MIIYILGLFNLLKWLSVVYLVLSVFILIRIRSKGFPRVDKISLLVLTLFSFLWLKAVPENFKFVNWDEFVSWGPNVKALTLDNSFYTNSGLNGTIGGGYKGYPPGQQIIQYLLTSRIGWSEQHVVWAQGLILILLILLILELEFHSLGLRKYILIVPIVSIFYYLDYSFTTIYADGLLALFGFVTYLISKDIFTDSKRKSFFLLIPPYLILVLLKPTGIIIGIFVLLMSLLQSEIMIKQAPEVARLRMVHRRCLNAIKKSLLPIVAMLTAYVSWRIYVGFHKIETLNFPFSGTEGRTLERIISTYDVFYERLSTAGIYFKIPGIERISTISLLEIIAIFLLFHATMFFYYISKKEMSTAFSGVIPAVMGIAYIFFVFLSYCFFIDEYERTSGGSISRYLGSFLLIILLNALFELLKILDKNRASKNITFLTLLVLQFALPTSQMKIDFVYSKPNLELLNERKNIEKQADLVHQYIARTDSVYYLSQGDKGNHKNIFGYLLMPNKVNFWCWSIGNPIFPGDIWTCDKSALNNLDSFDYVFIGKNDGQLTEEFLTGKDAKDGQKLLETGLYRIESKYNSQSQIILVSRLN
jgi:hypothetical protein